MFLLSVVTFLHVRINRSYKTKLFKYTHVIVAALHAHGWRLLLWNLRFSFISAAVTSHDVLQGERLASQFDWLLTINRLTVKEELILQKSSRTHPVLQESVFLSLSLSQEPLHLLDLGHVGGAGAVQNEGKTSVSFCMVPANFPP